MKKLVRQHTSTPREEGSHHSDTSRMSSPAKMSSKSENPHYSSESETQADSLPQKLSEATVPGSKSSGRERDSLYKTSQSTLYFPDQEPRSLKPRIHSESSKCHRDLKNRVKDLQHQLTEALNENKLLNRSLHRHKVALQYFQDTEGSISEILNKYSNEARVLQTLLNDNRACRVDLSRQLQATDFKLVNTKATLKHLKILSQDQSLLEREQLSRTLAHTSGELGDKKKRIKELERSLQLSETSFNRQLLMEQKKINEATDFSRCLQVQILRLTRELDEKEKKLQEQYIYSNRFLKLTAKKASKDKMVQTEGFIFPSVAASPLDFKYSQAEERLDEQNSGNLDFWEIGNQDDLSDEVKDLDMYTGKSLEDPTDDEDTFKVFENVLVSHEGPKADEQKGKENNSTKAKGRSSKFHKSKHSYRFKQATENLHNGIAATRSANASPSESAKRKQIRSPFAQGFYIT